MTDADSAAAYASLRSPTAPETPSTQKRTRGSGRASSAAARTSRSCCRRSPRRRRPSAPASPAAPAHPAALPTMSSPSHLPSRLRLLDCSCCSQGQDRRMYTAVASQPKTKKLELPIGLEIFSLHDTNRTLSVIRYMS